MAIQKITVTQDETGVRLDRWLKRHAPQLTPAWTQRLVREGQVRVDGRRAKGSERLEAGQVVRLPPFLDGDLQETKTAKALVSPRLAQELRQRILFQDKDMIALDKPAGMAVQGGTGIKSSLDRILADILGQTVHLVHRLDRETSGVLVVALNPFAADKLAKAFRERETEKSYWAITRGVPNPRSGLIDQPLAKQGKEIVVAKGKLLEEAQQAQTLYRVVDSNKANALVALWPQTGRTHQLRVHMLHIGTPLLGDSVYGPPPHDKKQGLFLHARRLVIPHPRSGKLVDIHAPLPPVFSDMLTTFGLKAPEDEPEAPFDPSSRTRRGV